MFPVLRRREGAPDSYQQSVEDLAGQLIVQGVFEESLTTLVVVPVVGFGEQSAAVLADTLDLLTAGISAYAGVLVLVNRPAHRPADSTVPRIQDWLDRHPGASVAVGEVALTQRPRLGELRQLGLDAAELAWGPLPGDGTLVLADDDLVAFPPGTVARLEQSLRSASLSVGPVLFDHPRLPMCLLPDLYAGDLFRALLADEMLGQLEVDRSAVPPEVLESLVLSCHLAVRRDALARVNGMRDLNELTGLARDVLADPASGTGAALRRPVSLHPPDSETATGSADRLTRLRRVAVRVHSRRALSAYTSERSPTVAQWRGARLQSSRVDPVRTRPVEGAPTILLSSLSSEGRRSAVADVGRHLGVVLDHLHPQHDLVCRMLAVLGIASGDVEIRPPSDSERWRIRLRRSTGLVDRLASLQEQELAEREGAWEPTVKVRPR